MDGTITTAADELHLRQRTTFGTTAWWTAYGRRNQAESTNSRIKTGGDVANIEAGFTRMMTTAKISLFLARTIGALNRRVLINWRRCQRRLAKHSAKPARKPRAGRLPRWEDQDSPTPAAGSDPPT